MTDEIKHELKTDSIVFDESFKGSKTFEIRYNDRGFSVGDKLLLRETQFSGIEMKNGSPLVYTGRSIEQIITYILNGPVYGLADGWVIMSVDTIGKQGNV